MGQAAEGAQGRGVAAPQRTTFEFEGEPEVVLVPAGRGGHPRGQGLRVVGPGRRERDYQERVERLEAHVDGLQRSLEDAALVERGVGRYADRLEAELAAAQHREAEVRQQLHRTLVLLGAAQREAEGLRAALAAPLRPRIGTEQAPRRFWARLFGREQ